MSGPIQGTGNRVVNQIDFLLLGSSYSSGQESGNNHMNIKFQFIISAVKKIKTNLVIS